MKAVRILFRLGLLIVLWIEPSVEERWAGVQ